MEDDQSVLWRMTRVYEVMRLEMYVNVPGCVSEPVHSRTLGHTLQTIMYFKVFYVQIFILNSCLF